MNKKLIQVWQCGGGTQSVRIALGICRGEFPKPDFSVAADTTYERSTTWAYMDSVLVPKLREVGVDLIRVSAAKYAYNHDGLFNNKGTLLVPAFSTTTEAGGKMSNFCTSYWKRDVIDNFMRREHGISPSQCCKWIGFSLDEMRRAVRMMSSKSYQEGRIFFPLIDRRLRRADSIRDVIAAGWPMPPRSNCYLCPNQHDDEWIDLRDNSPAEFQLAIQYERMVRERDPDAYFHSSRVPLDQVIFQPSKPDTSRGCDSGVCFV